ncbi:unnamed protein product [Cladocopium goreaui]|uniref:Polycystin cation channel PKD1/PKD2 domain-containing protein n=1 Tax=Cladocopium goreaui TaxID=2562237 RepID=A0A9P1FRU8_9DINO|nr:unnamed protein product [Cladocopium goreaui]
MAEGADAKLYKEFHATPQSLDILSLRTLLRLLQSERRNRAERLEVLEDRLQITNSELAFRRCEADECRDKLYEAQRKHQAGYRERDRYALADGYDQAAEALEQRTAQIRRSMEQVLLEQITQVFGREKRDQHGFVTQGVRDLMIIKSEQEEVRERTFRDTILVTYVMPYSEQKQHLTYRVADSTTVKTLKEDACMHWELNEAEFVLKVANNSKVHDALKVTACFRPNEDGHFLLVYKTPKNPSVLPSEYADILPKHGRKRFLTRREEGRQDMTSIRMQGAKVKSKSLAEEMLLLPGLFRFMTQRDRKVKKHLRSLRLRTICAYFVLVFLTAFSIAVLRPPRVGYECTTGISETITGGQHPQTFDTIRSEEDIWQWLEKSVSVEVFSDDSMLREYNYLVGYLQVLIQQVSQPSPANCKGVEGEASAANFSCVHSAFADSTADRSPQRKLENHWASKVAQDGRSMEKPWEYRKMSHPTSGAHSEAQAFQRTDGSGNRFEYQLQYTPLSVVRSAFLSDMHFLKQAGWLSDQTRALHLSFVAYNANHQMWIWNRYTLEVSAFGTIHPLAHIEPFRPHLLEYGLDYELLISDIVRFCLLLFLILQELVEFRHECKETGSSWKQLVTVQTLVDFSILIFFLVALGFRISYYASEPSVSYALSHLDSFRDAGQVAENYGVHVCLESVLLALCLYRFVYFLRVNRSVYIVWLSVARSASYLLRLSPLLLLVFLGFLVLGMSAGNKVHECNRNFGAMVSCSLLILSGDYHPAQLEPGESLRLIYVILLFCFGRLIVANIWLSILMQEYHSARVEAGFSPETYKWREYDWVNWCMPWPLNRLYLKLRPSIVPLQSKA